MPTPLHPADLEGLNDLALFKMAKRILRGELDYPVLPVDSDRISDCMGEEVRTYTRLWGLLTPRRVPNRPIELVDPTAWGIEGYTVAREGFFAFESGIRMAILNCDELSSEVFDESAVCGMLLGRRVSKIQNDILARCPRYIHVDEANPHFASENHVLYAKDKKLLIRYAPGRPEEEFRVPPTVRELSNCAFSMAFNLKKLYLPRRIRMHHEPYHTLGWAYIPDGVEVIYYDP